MVRSWEIARYIKRHEDNLKIRIDENDMIINKENDMVLCSLDEFTDRMRKNLHCDFECIYSCHGTLQVVLRCRECGTVIFASDDVDYCDDNLCCPVCANYDTHFKYYTGEEILSDEKKQEEIRWYEEMTKEQIEEDKRWKKRNGKCDWEIFKGRIKIGSDKAIYYCLECDNLFKSGLKGLRLDLNYAVKDNDISYVYKKRIVIPLSYSAFKIQRSGKRWRNEN